MPQQFTLSGRATSLPPKSPLVAAGLLKGSLGNSLFEATTRRGGGFNFTAEFANGALRGFVKPVNSVAGCERPASWNGVITSGLGRFAGLKGTFFLSTTPLLLPNVDKNVPIGFTMHLNGTLS